MSSSAGWVAPAWVSIDYVMLIDVYTVHKLVNIFGCCVMNLCWSLCQYTHVHVHNRGVSIRANYRYVHVYGLYVGARVLNVQFTCTSLFFTHLHAHSVGSSSQGVWWKDVLIARDRSKLYQCSSEDTGALNNDSQPARIFQFKVLSSAA